MAKGIYREAAKARRLGKSALKSLTKSLSLTKSKISRKLIRRQIRTLKTNISRSYRGTGYSIEEAVGKINSIVQPQKGMSARQRARQVTVQSLPNEDRNVKGRGKARVTKASLKVFWRRTVPMWKGGPKNQRLQRVIDFLDRAGYDVHDAGEAFDVVMRDPSVDDAMYHESLLTWYQSNEDYKEYAVYADVIHTAADIHTDLYKRKSRR